jgi:hypothetical protein
MAMAMAELHEWYCLCFPERTRRPKYPEVFERPKELEMFERPKEIPEESMVARRLKERLEELRMFMRPEERPEAFEKPMVVSILLHIKRFIM